MVNHENFMRENPKKKKQLAYVNCISCAKPHAFVYNM